VVAPNSSVGALGAQCRLGALD